MAEKKKHMFSNGTEYELFMDNNCFICRKYVYWEDATPEKPVCPIEEKLWICSMTGKEEDWPKEIQKHWKEVGEFKAAVWECKEFEKEDK